MMSDAKMAGSGYRGIASGTKKRAATTAQKTKRSVVSFITCKQLLVENAHGW